MHRNTPCRNERGKKKRKEYKNFLQSFWETVQWLIPKCKPVIKHNMIMDFNWWIQVFICIPSLTGVLKPMYLVLYFTCIISVRICQYSKKNYYFRYNDEKGCSIYISDIQHVLSDYISLKTCCKLKIKTLYTEDFLQKQKKGTSGRNPHNVLCAIETSF